MIDTKEIEYGDYRLVLNYIDNGVETIMYPAEDAKFRYFVRSKSALDIKKSAEVCDVVSNEFGFITEEMKESEMAALRANNSDIISVLRVLD